MNSIRSSSQVILIGGFCEIVELCELCNKQIVGIIDNKLNGQYLSYKILGKDNIAPELYNEYENIPLIITPDAPEIRRKLSIYYSKIGFWFCNLISPKTTISKYAKIGNGVIIQSGVNISSMVYIGDFVKINSCVNIMHDSRIEKFITIAPNAVVLGRVKIFESCYIGANSTILPERIINKKAIVGAGAIVTKDVKEGATVIGVPARETQKDKNHA